jgi:hypothetical protein
MDQNEIRHTAFSVSVCESSDCRCMKRHKDKEVSWRVADSRQGHGPPTLGLALDDASPYRKKLACCEVSHRGLVLGRIPWHDLTKLAQGKV